MSRTPRTPSAVAVVGIHGRFPNAADLDRFWSNLTHGRDAIDLVPADRWDWAAIHGDPADEGERTHANQGGFTPHVDRFDHGFFGIMPREAQSMDPQQRLFLQAAWSALEDAGYPPSTLAGRKVGVFAAVGNADYPVLMRRDGVPIDVYRGTGIALTAVANRVSFLLDLHGPSQTIDTACSGSLVAIHRAVQAIEAGECEMAIAGGVSLLLGPELFIAFAKAGMLSPTGRCRTFDAEADGYVRGEGVGAVVVVPLEVAEANGDHIHGVIRGSAENHGGRAHSFTAPNAGAQAAVVSDAWRKAALPLSRAALIETHGTGTPLGDPIEINALRKSLSDTASETDGAGPSAILLGAVKSHIGHLEAAAGIAGVIKTLLSLQHRLVPGNLHFRSLNPHIKTGDTPLRMAERNTPLGTGGAPPVAGVSSFGFGGVNAHVVIEAPPTPRAHEATPDGRPYPVLLSARSEASLRGRAAQLRRLLVRRRASAPASADGMQAELARALDLPPSFERAEARDTPLATLGLSVERLFAAIESLGRRLEDVRDRVTLGEVADRLAELARPDEHGDDGDADVLLPSVALPRALLDRLSLAGIALTTMHGRDAMEERLAIVATSLSGLEDTLSRFLSGDGKGEGQDWWRGTTRGRKAATPPPPDPAGWPTVAELAAWAAHWVTTKAAAPRWEVLCPGQARPGKIPLPAYPFRLDRVWYEARSGEPATPAPAAGPRIATIDGAPASAAPDVPLPDGAADNWARCWGGGTLVPPSSMAALGVLAAQVARRGHGAVSLARISFGRPTALTGAAPIVRAARPVVQCLAPATPPLVLAQAELSPRTAPPPPLPDATPGARRLDGAAFYGLLARHGFAVATPYRFVTGAEMGADAMTLHCGREPRGNAFWTALLAALLAGAEALGGGGEGPLALRAIASLDMDARLMEDIARLTLRAAADAGPGPALDLDAVTADGRMALAIRGMEFRPIPADLHASAPLRRAAS